MLSNYVLAYKNVYRKLTRMVYFKVKLTQAQNMDNKL